MTFVPIRLKGGGVAFVHMRESVRRPGLCSVCEMAPGTQLCDGTHPTRAGTCDAALCVWCSKREGEADFCPRCAQARVITEVARWPESLRSDFEERAALIEDGCKVTRATSERMAFDLLKKHAPVKDQTELKLEK